MPGRRETLTRDMKRNSAARKRTHKKTLAEQQQQAETLRRIEANIRAAGGGGTE